MNKDFLENLINDLEQINDDTEKLALENMHTNVWRIHTKQQELLKTLKFYYTQELLNE